jgi:glutamate---cysteine ligase / carboxylate-amine ligase
VAIPPGFDRVQVMNRLVPWTPLLLALSASSPFWCGESTGLASYRQSAYDEWPRTGTPPLLADESVFTSFVERLVAAGCLEDGRSIWWTIRPSTRYPTLELRITDACTDLEETIAIAAAYRCLVRSALVGELSGAPAEYDRELVEESRWRAKRHGLAALLIHPDSGKPALAAHLVAELVDRLREQARALSCERELSFLRDVVETGGGAARQAALFDLMRAEGASPRAAVQVVVEDLIARTTAAPFLRPASGWSAA